METDALEDRYYLAVAAAFVRGREPAIARDVKDDGDVFRAGLAHGLKLHKFKRNADLPRVRRVLIHLFDRRSLALLFEGAGARRVAVEHVLNHVVLLAMVA